MANTSVSDQVRARVEAFVDELSDLIRQSAMDTVHKALAGDDAPRRGGRRAGAGAGRPAASAARSQSRGRAKGAKRSPDELDELTTQLLTYIKSNSGQRIEQIAQGMGTSTKELNLPAKKLLSKKAIRTKGHKRATQYFSR
ncbi:MAG TPA: DNA-binding protein [Polyangiaceae bacterium]|nr:DNA-binding protein [Polyangiaceae bacterium]